MRGVSWVAKRLDARSTVYAACLASLVLGLIFVFVWSPLPWGWLGIDHYHDRAVGLANGEPFDTTDVPWGYAYFLAMFYTLFGPQPAIPLVAQVLLNALVPLLLYRLVRPLTSERIAVTSAVLVSVLSFNTVYAATQSSDSVCTVIFLAMLLAFAHGVRTQSVWAFAASGLAAGVAAQFRPNLILFPLVAAVVYLIVRPRSRVKLAHVAVFLTVVAASLVPWILRNHRLTGLFLPTSTHGGIQLWYGTLQMGPYLESRAHNPRSVFEAESFDYTSLPMRPIEVRVWPWGCDWGQTDVVLMMWTDRDGSRVSIPARKHANGSFGFEIPGQPLGTTIYYYVEGRWPDSETTSLLPLAGNRDPFVFAVSDDHLGNLDRHDDLVDIFDLVALVRAATWNAVPPHARLDFDADGKLSDNDIRQAVAALLTPSGTQDAERDPVAGIRTSDAEVVLTFRDESTLSIPREGTGRVTDLTVNGALASRLIYGRRSWASLGQVERKPIDPADQCRQFDRIEVNRAFASRESHLMRRYTALALDNIQRDPGEFVAASLYRLVRLFIIRGTSDRDTTQQFPASSFIYTLGFLASVGFLALFLAGAVIAWRRGDGLEVLLVPILYVPLTICFVLTNMRYTITVQPLMFAFVATALVTIFWRRIDNPTVTCPL